MYLVMFFLLEIESFWEMSRDTPLSPLSSEKLRQTKRFIIEALQLLQAQKVVHKVKQNPARHRWNVDLRCHSKHWLLLKNEKTSKKILYNWIIFLLLTYQI